MLKQHVKMVCLQRGITMAQLADEAGVSLGSLSLWVRGKAMPRAKVVPKVASVLGLTPAELVGMLMEPRA